MKTRNAARREPGGAQWTEWAESGLDGIRTLAISALVESTVRPIFLLRSPKGSHERVGLPARGLHQLGQRGSVGPFQQVQTLAALLPSRCALSLGGLGRFLRGAGLLGRLPLLGRNVRALLANRAFFWLSAFRRLPDEFLR